MNSKIKDTNTDFLFQAILQLHTMEECYQFFEDLCTAGGNQGLVPADRGGQNAQR